MTPNKEDYLKCIYFLGEESLNVTNKNVAVQMQVSAPAVSEMIKKLVKENLVKKDRKSGYLLTNEGMYLVSSLYRKHRLLELFLINDLDYSAKNIHQEAEILEHSVSDMFINQLERKLNFPKFCPHGGVIPRKGEILQEYYTNRLSDQTDLGTYVIKRHNDHKDLISYLDNNKLRISDCFTLVEINNYTQTMIIQKDNNEYVLPLIITKQLFVEKV